MIFISFVIEKIIIHCLNCAHFVPPNLLYTHKIYLPIPWLLLLMNLPNTGS